MKILMSSYSCETNRGSEPGVGWNWVTSLAKQGHEVHALIYPIDRPNIEQYLENNPIPKLNFIYVPTNGFIDRFYLRTSKLIYIHYFYWQILAFFKAKSLLKTEDFDLVHHITMGSFRIPSWMGFLGLPFIFGPVGGGEEAAPSLVKNLPLKFRIKESIRSLANKLAVWNPLMFLTFRSSSLIYCKTQETAKLIPSIFQHKVRVFMEIGIHEDDLMLVEPVAERDTGTLHILFVGRLIYWKGAHLVLKSVARLREQGFKVRLTIVGEGAESTWIKDLARQLGIYEQTDWISSIAQHELFKLYSSYDLMLFPSLHDSSGNVVLESLAHALPVLCLDLGGPKELVDESCGAVIPTQGFDEKACVEAISQQIEYWINHPEVLADKKAACIELAAKRSWANVSKQNLQIIQEHLAIA